MGVDGILVSGVGLNTESDESLLQPISPKDNTIDSATGVNLKLILFHLIYCYLKSVLSLGQ